MRFYDLKSGMRFDMHHPIWMEYNTTKKGEVSSRLTHKTRQALERAGHVDLVRSVSEIAKIADNDDAFGAGSRWGVKMTVEAWDKIQSHCNEGDIITPDDLSEATFKEMAGPRDKGSELHECYHKWRKGELTKPTPDQEVFARICDGYVHDFLDADRIETEVPVVSVALRTGGTPDVLGFLKKGNVKAGMDWKTVKEHREPRKSELAQVGGYSIMCGWEQVWIVYFHQTKHTTNFIHLDGAKLKACERLFIQCNKVVMAIDDCLELVGGSEE